MDKKLLIELRNKIFAANKLMVEINNLTLELFKDEDCDCKKEDEFPHEYDYR